jgi:hypothetical protein
MVGLGRPLLRRRRSGSIAGVRRGRTTYRAVQGYSSNWPRVTAWRYIRCSSSPPTAPRDSLGRFRTRDRAGTWLAVPSSSCQPKSARDREEGQARRTLALAVLRGALLDLLATGDADRVTTAVRHHLALLAPVSTSASSGGARNKAGMHSIASCSRRRARDRECASAAR